MQLAENVGHAVEKGGVVGEVRKVRGIVRHHRVVRSPIRVGRGERSAGHGHWQLDVVRRIRGHEIDRRVTDLREKRQGVTDAQLTSGRVKRARTSGIVRSEVGKHGTRPVVLGGGGRDYAVVDGRPAR